MPAKNHRDPSDDGPVGKKLRQEPTKDLKTELMLHESQRSAPMYVAMDMAWSAAEEVILRKADQKKALADNDESRPLDPEVNMSLVKQWNETIHERARPRSVAQMSSMR